MPANEAGGDEDQGTRLFALNMALNGAPREEASKQLRETFGIVADEILDEVYDHAGGEPTGRLSADC